MFIYDGSRHLSKSRPNKHKLTEEKLEMVDNDARERSFAVRIVVMMSSV